MPLTDFLNRSAPRHPSIRQTLVRAGVPFAAEPSGLTIVERPGSYSGRRVSFFRAFDPAQAAARSIQVSVFHDLDAHPDLVLGSGHVEREGLVMLDGRARAEGPAPDRSPADRAVHGDDDRFVFQPLRSTFTPPMTSPDPG